MSTSGEVETTPTLVLTGNSRGTFTARAETSVMMGVSMSAFQGAGAPPAGHETGTQAAAPKAAEQAMPADAAQRALPGRSRRPLEGGWDFYTQGEIQPGGFHFSPAAGPRRPAPRPWSCRSR